jgi:chemotaxis protein methyltransferase CheR
MMAGDEVEALEIRLVLEAIYAQYGYDLRDYTTSSMNRRVMAALRNSGLAHLGELQHKLLTDREFFTTVLDALTVRVTELFRDPGFHLTFRERVVPLLRTYPRFKIWHAGCASGEEVYTSAILLTEENLYERSQIYATDISEQALEQARAGIFSEQDVQKFAQNYAQAGGTGRFEDYFSSGYGRMVVREALRRNIVFFHHDLVTDFALGEMHVIFCRNVLIYFGSALRDRVLGMIAGSLRHGGFLCLGQSESLPASAAAAFTDFSPRERIFRRSAA